MTSNDRIAEVEFYADPARLCRDEEPSIDLDPQQRRELASAFAAFRAGTLTNEQAISLCSAAESEGAGGLFVHRDELIAADPPASREAVPHNHPIAATTVIEGDAARRARRPGR